MVDISHTAIGIDDSVKIEKIEDADGLSCQMVTLLREHFWCDFSDIIAALKWDDSQPRN